MKHSVWMVLVGLVLVTTTLAVWLGPAPALQKTERRAFLPPKNTVSSFHSSTSRSGPRPPEGFERFTLPPGLRVELAVKQPEGDPAFSLINLAFDNKGRLLVSREGGPVLLCTGPDKDGVLQNVKPYCEQVTNCHGMCWIDDALFLVGFGPQEPLPETYFAAQLLAAPASPFSKLLWCSNYSWAKPRRGLGLYRVRDTKGADKVDEVKLLHSFVIHDIYKGVEHGPHSILHGPDGWLYLVVGNEAWAKPRKLADNSPLLRWPTGQMGPDQGKPGSTEDLLLPRQNDALGEAVGICAPGGTIWRLDREGKNMSLVAAGFRNEFDAAFSPTGELFTLDGDQQWDDGLPWYRPVRVHHCPPGADFVWRSGTANTPDYYIDSLPGILKLGHGCFTGMEFYDHTVFPKKYRGACFVAEWSEGGIYVAHFERDGASYKGRLEKFAQGAPMKIVDLAVGPDGALYFVMGGRGNQGGVCRIVYEGNKEAMNGNVQQATQRANAAPLANVETLLAYPQPLAAYSKAQCQSYLHKDGTERELIDIAQDKAQPVLNRIRALDLMMERAAGLTPAVRPAGANMRGRPAARKVLLSLFDDPNAEVRAHAIMLLGASASKESRDGLVRSLKDKDALVRRRACEALIRAGLEPPVDALWPLLNEPDRFVRTAARLVLQRIDPKKWTDRLWKEEKDLIACEGIFALCKTNLAAPYTVQIITRLNKKLSSEPEILLGQLRALQMALIHTQQQPRAGLVSLAERCDALFPHKDWRINRELAILLTHFRRNGVTDKAIHAKLLKALLAAKDDRQQQIHYFYCLRLLHHGWTQEQKEALLTWYNSIPTRQVSHTIPPHLNQILREAMPIFAERLPKAPAQIADLYVQLVQSSKESDRLWRKVLLERLQSSTDPGVEPAWRRIADAAAQSLQPILAKNEERDIAIGFLTRFPPSDKNWDLLLPGLESTNSRVVFDVIETLKKIPLKPVPVDAAKPKPNDVGTATVHHHLILARNYLDERDRWKVVELLRHWNDGKDWGYGNWKDELAAWSEWYHQTFPNAKRLPDISPPLDTQPKYDFVKLLAYLEKDPKGRNGDKNRGKAAFKKANCFTCHKHGNEGTGIGPDLTEISKRYKRAVILQKLFYPSKFVNDRYRATTIVRKNGQRLDGIATLQGDSVILMQPDGSSVTLKKTDIEQQVASLISLMPTNLLDSLEMQEIADLFAFLEAGR